MLQDTQLLPNSFVFLSIRSAAYLEWHPFTLAYVRNSDQAHRPAKATLHIKPYGRWGQVQPMLICTKTF